MDPMMISMTKIMKTVSTRKKYFIAEKIRCMKYLIKDQRQDLLLGNNEKILEESES